MTRISNVDQVLLLLREQLQRTERKRAAAPRGGPDRTGASEAPPLDRARALAALDTLGEEEVRRALVRGLLAEAFGDSVSNDAALVTIVDEVTRIIGEKPEGAELMNRAVAQLKEARQ